MNSLDSPTAADYAESATMKALLSQVNVVTTSPELLVAFLGACVICLAALWSVYRWLTSGPLSPDPWDADTAAALNDDSARPICHRCLSENDPEADFCAHCGATIGQYTNWLPYPYIFSLGHTLRIGSSGEYRRSPWLVLGFILLSAGEYVLFAPIYWFMLLRGLLHKPSPEPVAKA